MINSLLTFGAKSVNPEILEQTLTTREDIVNEIEKNCISKTLNTSTFQSLIIATRGSGKTHIIKVLYHRFKNNKKISKKSVIAYMSEDEVGIANFTDLMISILRAIIRYKEPGSETIEDQIMDASLIKDTNQREIFVKDILNRFAKKRIIILLIENFDKVLNALGEQGQGSLRNFIHQYNNLSIIATSQNLIANLQDSKNPFYNFFNVSQLNKLDLNQSIEFLRSIAIAENNQPLLEELKQQSFEGKLRAIYELTEGNHRLLVTFYAFLKAELKTELSKIFIKVMNDLKPYYEQFVNVLPAQQQKIVKYLSLKRGAISGKEIARACFIEPNVFSKQISLLYAAGLIDKNKSGKDVYYELKEPLMRISFEISESTNGIAKLFVDFLSCFYDNQEIRNQYVLFKYGGRFQTDELKQIFENEALMFDAALDENERAKIAFGHQLYNKANNIIELDEILHSANSNVLTQLDQAYEYFNIGNSLVKNGQLKEALKNYKKVLKFDPYNEFVNFNIGLTYSKLKENKKAILNFEKTIDINPENVQSLIGLGHTYGVLKQYEKAKKYYNMALEVNPGDYWARYGLGTIFIVLEEYEEGINYLEEATKIKSDDFGPFLSLGRAYIEVNNLDKSITNYQKVIELNPQFFDAFIELGNLFLDSKQFEKAKIYFQNAIQINSKSEGAYLGLGEALDGLNLVKEAIICFKKIIEINPNNYWGYFKLGQLLLSQDMFEDAKGNFIKAIEINIDFAEGYNGLAITYGFLNNSVKAEEYFRKAIGYNSKNVTSLFGLGLALLDLEKYQVAIDQFRKVIEINSSNYYVYNHLGIAYMKVKQFEKAITSFKTFVNNDPNNIDAYNNMGVAYLLTDKIDKAFDTFKEGLNINPENHNLKFSLLGAYIRINDQTKSKKMLNNLIGKVENDLLQVSLTEDVFYNLFKFGSQDFMKSYLSFLLKLIIKKNKNNQFWKAMSDSLFDILITIEDYDKERLANIESILLELLGEYEKSIIPLKMFSNGVAYLKNNEKNAIFKLSKEERKLFKEAVLNERNVEK